MQNQNKINPPVKIHIGCQVGALTVVRATSERKNGYTVWVCLCTCGNEILLDTRYLQRGTITDCGCRSGVHPHGSGNQLRPGQKNLTGQPFGRLTCLSPSPQRGKDGCVLWTCQCSCGKICTARSTQLIRGTKKSCGCLSHPERKDLIGARFGKLTVIDYAEKRRGMHHWKCRCDCGAQTVVGQTLLQSGKTKSCGCLQTSTLLQNLKLCEGTSVAQLEAGKKRRLSTNSSGCTGVYRHKASGKWAAQITFKGKTYYLGCFDQLDDAIAARKQGEEMHDRFLEWYYSRQNTAPDSSE